MKVRQADRRFETPMKIYGAIPARNDWRAFLATLILATPSTMAFLCALALVRDVPWLPFSGLWFIYEVSRYVAYVGIVICAGIVVAEATQHRTSRKFVVLLGLSLAGAVLLLWYAVQIFENSPW